VTIFLGCGFAAKYPEGGGNFSVPLQWMLGLRRLGLDAVWLDLLPATTETRAEMKRAIAPWKPSILRGICEKSLGWQGSASFQLASRLFANWKLGATIKKLHDSLLQNGLGMLLVPGHG
jgi:hypothetical protein